MSDDYDGQRGDALLLVCFVKVVADVAAELGEEEGRALGAPALVADRVLDLDLVEHGAVIELDKQRVTDGALLGVMIVDAETAVLDAEDFGA